MARTGSGSASRTIVWGVLLLVVIGLGGFGARNFSSGVRTLGKVGSTDIEVSRYARQLNQDMRALQAQTGTQFGMTEAKAFGVDRAALGKVVAEVAQEDEAHRIGLSVGDAEVQKALLQIPDFKGFDGKFDRATYQDLLKRNNVSVAEFETELRAKASRGLLDAAVTGGVRMPATETTAVYAWAGERRSFDWVELTASDLAQPIQAPTDADLKAWYDAHPALYTLPEAKAITYAWITPSMLVDKIAVDEDALKKLYQDRSAEYHKPERRLLERLVFPTMDAAQQAWDRLQKGEIDFAGLVAERKLTLEDIDMGDVAKDDLGAVGDAVFALTQPGLVGPLDTDLGPAIFRVNGILAAEDTPFADVRDELKAAYATDRARRQISDMQEQVSDLLAGGATLEEVADQTDLELGKIDYTKDSEGGIAGYADFQKAAAAVKDGDFPDVATLDDGGIFALRLDKVIPPRLQDQAAVAEKVGGDWTDDATRTALEKMADEILPRISQGEDPGSFGLTMNHEDALRRDAFLADTPEGLVAKAFDLTKGTAGRIGGTAGTPNVTLVKTTAVLAPDPDNTDMTTARDKYQVQMDQALADDVLGAWTRAIETGAGVTVNEAAVNAVNAQFK